MKIEEMKRENAQICQKISQKSSDVIKSRLQMRTDIIILKALQKKQRELAKEIFILEGKVTYLPAKKERKRRKKKEINITDQYLMELPKYTQAEMLKRLIAIREVRQAKNPE